MAAEQIANLAVFVRGDASFLARDLDKGIRDASQKVKVSTIALGNLIAEGIEAGVEAAAKAVAELTAHVKKSMDDIRGMTQSAMTMNVSTEWLSSMQSAYRQLGGEAEDLRDAMMDLFERTAEAATDPTGDAGEAFQLLRLDVEAVRKLAPEQQFMKVYDALSKVKDAGARIFIARSLMSDSGGDAMLKLINAGREGLDEMRKKAELYGTVIRDDVAKEIGRASDATANLKEAWTGVGIQLAAKLAPHLEKAAAWVGKMLKDSGGVEKLLDQWVVKTIDWVGTLSKGWQIARAIGGVFEAAGSMVAGIGHTLHAGFQVAVKGIEVLIQDLYKDLTEIYNKIIKTIEDAVNGLLRGIEKTFSFIKDNYNELRNLLGLPVEGIGPGKAATVSLPRATVPDQPDYAELEAAVQHFEDTVAASFEAIRDASAEAVEKVGDVFSEGGPDSSLFPGLDKASNGVDDLEKQAREAHEVMKMLLKQSEEERKKAEEAAKKERDRELSERKKAMLDAAYDIYRADKQVMDSIADMNRDTVADIVSGWITGTARISDVMSRWANQMIEQFVHLALWGNKASGGSLTGLLGGMTGGTGNLIGSAFSAIFGGARASGGPVEAGKVYVTGEKGRELFVPGVDGMIVPNSALDGTAAFARMESGGGGAPVVVNMNFSSGVQHAELAVLAEDLKEQVTAGILDAVGRGGGFRRRIQS